MWCLPSSERSPVARGTSQRALVTSLPPSSLVTVACSASRVISAGPSALPQFGLLAPFTFLLLAHLSFAGLLARTFPEKTPGAPDVPSKTLSKPSPRVSPSFSLPLLRAVLLICEPPRG